MRETFVRAAEPADQDFLWAMLFEACHAGEQGFSSPDEIRPVPGLARYVEDWGGPGDLGVIGGWDGSSMGAAWLRRFTAANAAYGYVDDNTPELAIAVDPAARGAGLGTSLMTRLLEQAEARYDGICLNVRTENPAHGLYLRLGFADIPGSDMTNWAGTRSVNMLLRFR